MNKDLTLTGTTNPAKSVLAEVVQLEAAQDRMFDAVVDSCDVTLDGLYAEVDKAIRKLKERAEYLKAQSK